MSNNKDLMDQLANAYSQEHTQKQEPSKMDQAKNYFNSGVNAMSSRLSTQGSDLEGQNINMANEPAQKSSSGFMSLFQKE